MSCEHTTFSLVFVNMPTGKTLRVQTKEVVVNVYEYFEAFGRRKWTEGSLKRTSERLSTGGAAFSNPTKRYRFYRRLLVDDFDREAIRRKIYHLYRCKEHVTLSKLFVVLKEDNLFHGQRSTLHTLLREMGFK